MNDRPINETPEHEQKHSGWLPFAAVAFLLVGLFVLVFYFAIRDGFTILHVTALLIVAVLGATLTMHARKMAEARTKIDRLLDDTGLVPQRYINSGKSPLERLSIAISYLAEKVVVFKHKEKESAEHVKSLEKESEILRKRIDTLSRQDPLTGLRQRHFFDDELNRELMRSVRIQRPLTLVFIQILNMERYGSDAGEKIAEEAVATIGHIISSNIRCIDHAFSYDEDTFALILPCTDAENVLNVTDRICALIHRYKFPIVSNEKFKFEIGIGSSTTSEKIISSEKLAAAAQRALNNKRKHSPAASK